MRVLQINAVYPNGSTGKIAKGIQELCFEKSIENYVAYRYCEGVNAQEGNTYHISSWLDCHIHNRISQHTMLQGYFSRIRTIMFLHWVKKYNPDIIHLHNIHGSFINIPLLFRFIKKNDIKTVWTMHDCWSFTGGCAYYDLLGCEKWKTQCSCCPMAKQDKKVLLDCSRFNYKTKRKCFCGAKNIVIVSNSQWTDDQVAESFMRGYPHRVIYNGINLSVFRRVEGSFRASHEIENKKIVLGVAYAWDKRKGLDVFIKLSQCLDSNYQIVLVGTNSEIDKILPDSIISVHKTGSQSELAEIYSAADVFVNPTREEAFGMVNIEALACGTPGITFNTGGSPECFDELCGAVVEKDDIDALVSAIKTVCNERPFSQENCRKRATLFDEKLKYREYISLYEELCDE